METTQTKLLTLEEAKRYISEKYVFNATNYPIINKLDTRDDRLVFAVNHSLLHLSKIMYAFLDEYRFISSFGSSRDKEKLKEYSVKMLVNIIKLADSMETLQLCSGNDMADSPEPEILDLLLPISMLSTECEKYDHGGRFNGIQAKLAICLLWDMFLKRVAHLDYPWSLNNLIGFIPDYMKSK